jgi:hypothetical protein
MSDPITDELLDHWASPLCAGFFPEHALAREVQDSRKKLTAIRALIDQGNRCLITEEQFFDQVKALLDGEL